MAIKKKGRGLRPARATKRARLSAAGLPGARKAKLPGDIGVQLATLAGTPPVGPDWLFEIKFDGYRIVAVLDQGNVRLFSRNRLDWTSRLLQLADAVGELNARSAVLDGEAVVQNAAGVTDFQSLQEALSAGETGKIVYFAFDLLYLDGYDLRPLPLIDRKRALKQLLAGAPARVQFSEHHSGDGVEMLRQSCALGLEGIIAKQATGKYVPGRGRDWLKIKCSGADEFVIGGFTDPAGARQGLGSLLLGYYDSQQRLIYAGRVGTGFTEAVALELRRKLDRLEQKETPFAIRPKLSSSRRVHWVRPQLVAQIQYSNFTRDGLLRHPSFKGLREDKLAKLVRHDMPIAVSTEASPPPKPAGETKNKRN